MLIKRRKGWELPDSAATPEHLVLDRRSVLRGVAGSAMGSMMGGLIVSPALAQRVGGFPYPRNAAFTLDRPITDEDAATTYNNFYEFGSQKSIARAAQRLKTDPWTITIDGLVEKPIEIGFADLAARMQQEERLYRHRCVEAWAMAVPWTGFTLKQLVEFARPLSGAKYVRFATFKNADMAPGQRQVWYPWPYIEGVTMAEAANDLAFLVTGVYGKPLPKQMGAPLRLALPWKYGFKSIKSIDRITFTDTRPVSFWEEVQGSEYGFWANVNPEVPHPRWSQARERMLGTGEYRPTQIFNGYGDQVAHLYRGLEGERLYL